ncbi:ras-related and estrogen-regulated growth inhibitor-like protein [Arapaima gigas]
MSGTASLQKDANIVVLGTDSVGKSALTVRFLTRRFIGEYGHIESIYSHNVMLDGREIVFNIWDFPFSQELPSGTYTKDKRIQWADGFILVYSICDRASFNGIVRQVQYIKAAKDFIDMEKVPIVIVGNKRDLHHQRAVSSEEGQLMALATGCQFHEVSAAENYHSILMVFHGLVDRLQEGRSVTRRPTGIKSIVKSMSAVFSRRRTDSV